MAADAETDPEESVAEPVECAPCRGAGKLTSGLGGTPHEVSCPWCEGGGRTIPGHDAQAARRGEGQPE